MNSCDRRGRHNAMMFALAALSTTSSVAAAESAGSRTRKAEPPRVIEHATRLLANTSNTVRSVVTGVCESDGARQIARILEHASFEEMWVHLPRAHGTGDCQWHEIGRDEKSGTDSSYVRVDMAYLESLMTRNDEIVVYHFHPLRFFDCAADAKCPREMPHRAGAPDARWITDLVLSMPSPSDVHFMMDVTSRFKRQHPAGGKISHKVVTPHGVVDYGLTAAGLAKFDAEKYSRSEGLYITWIMASRLADDRVAAVAREHSESLAAAVRELARTLNTEFLRVVHSGPAPALSGGR